MNWWAVGIGCAVLSTVVSLFWWLILPCFKTVDVDSLQVLSKPEEVVIKGEKGEKGEKGDKGDAAPLLSPEAIQSLLAPIQKKFLATEVKETRDGLDGVNGLNGADGKDGKDGADGKDALNQLPPFISSVYADLSDKSNGWIAIQGLHFQDGIIVQSEVKEILTECPIHTFLSNSIILVGPIQNDLLSASSFNIIVKNHDSQQARTSNISWCYSLPLPQKLSNYLSFASIYHENGMLYANMIIYSQGHLNTQASRKNALLSVYKLGPGDTRIHMSTVYNPVFLGIVEFKVPLVSSTDSYVLEASYENEKIYSNVFSL